MFRKRLHTQPNRIEIRENVTPGGYLSAVPAARLNARFHFQKCELVPRESDEN